MGIDNDYFLSVLGQLASHWPDYPPVLSIRVSTSATRADGWHFNAAASLKIMVIVGWFTPRSIRLT